jgi:SAM-dependent methyltransferase
MEKMLQYQSFPDAPGDSLSHEKLRALRFPSLSGKRFLDIGCNEGFFCGFALFCGACEAIGLDRSADFITRAHRRFPQAQFLCQSWDELPAGPFDVILLASALHYAEDQPGLIRRLTSLLAPGGVLVVELGIAPGDRVEWQQIDRGIDRRMFPTLPQLIEVLSPYAWKLIGDSVLQQGDPTPRHVVHISLRKPVAYLLMRPPGYGKTTLCRDLFDQGNIPVITNDALVSLIARGSHDAAPLLKAAITQNYKANHLDLAVRAVTGKHLIDELVTIWVGIAQQRDFALDGYFPESEHETIRQSLQEKGYLAVTLEWDHPTAAFPGGGYYDATIQSYIQSLSGFFIGRSQHLPQQGLKGFIDRVEIVGRSLQVDGWAINSVGSEQRDVSVSIDNLRLKQSAFENTLRADVQEYLQADRAMFGFHITFELPANVQSDAIGAGLTVLAYDQSSETAYVLPRSPNFQLLVTHKKR